MDCAVVSMRWLSRCEVKTRREWMSKPLLLLMYDDDSEAMLRLCRPAAGVA